MEEKLRENRGRETLEIALVYNVTTMLAEEKFCLITKSDNYFYNITSIVLQPLYRYSAQKIHKMTVLLFFKLDLRFSPTANTQLQFPQKIGSKPFNMKYLLLFYHYYHHGSLLLLLIFYHIIQTYIISHRSSVLVLNHISKAQALIFVPYKY